MKTDMTDQQKKKIMIVGSTFTNKGAQSMLFVTIDEIRKRIPDADIFFASTDRGDFSAYNFQYLFCSEDAKSIALNRDKWKVLCSRAARDTVKSLLGRREHTWKFLDLKHTISSMDLIIDISGFNLGKRWPVEIQESYLDNLRLAKMHHIPIILMPQSFGPFDYPPEKQHLIEEIRDLLPYAQKIYAREKEGYQMLKDTFHLSNVEMSTDLVLQNTGIELQHIFKNPPKMEVPVIDEGAVGVIPNQQCFRHGDKETILSLYQRIIEKLQSEGKKAYIFRHSGEDLDACRQIADRCGGSAVLLENDFSCLEYDLFVRQFDFLVCSRYHGIVHAYRNSVPCMLLGWAVKYQELADLFHQGRYAFDITQGNTAVDKMEAAVAELSRGFRKESQIISEKLEQIQKENCFKDDFFRNI